MRRTLGVAPLLACLLATMATAQDEGPRDQYTIELPAGWIEYDQSRLWGGSLEGLGAMVWYSSINFRAQEYEDRAITMAKMSTGAVPAFFVERVRAKHKLACNNFSDKARKETMKYIKHDQMFSKRFRKIRKLKGDTLTIAGCRGYRFLAETEAKDGDEAWVLDVHAVSDGKLLYLFSLRNLREHYDENLNVFEQIMRTLTLTEPENR